MVFFNGDHSQSWLWYKLLFYELFSPPWLILGTLQLAKLVGFLQVVWESAALRWLPPNPRAV